MKVANLQADAQEIGWVGRVSELVQKEQLDQKDYISWSGYHADVQIMEPCPSAIIQLLPLFRENEHSYAMMLHGKNMIKNATEHLNQGHIPVVVVDAALYPLIKKMQWTWPAVYGETKFVIMMGGLHIEMTFLAAIGKWLEGSGWTSVTTTGGVTTEGRAMGLEKGSNTARGQWAHQISLAALCMLQRQAYNQYTDNEDSPLEMNDWIQKQSREHPQFAYWETVIKLERLLMMLLKAQREGNYPLYLEALRGIVPWMFVRDHYNYARWMTVHISDQENLKVKCPSVDREFHNGLFVTQKAKQRFSLLAHDQIHEKLNAVVKGDGGVVGITENEEALKRWTVAGPEIARILNDYEVTFDRKQKGASDLHHEQHPSTQRRFAMNVRNVTTCIDEKGNPFLEDSADLLTLHTKIIMPPEVVESVKCAEATGHTQWEAFARREPSHFHDAIPRNNLPLFASHGKQYSKKTSQLAYAKDDVNLFSRLYISCQNREGDVDTFFSHENHAWPPSLAENGEMRGAESKSDILKQLEPMADAQLRSPDDVQVKIVDGAALAQGLEPKSSSQRSITFSDYAQNVFVPNILRKMNTCDRCDVVWDIYREDSLKAHTRATRGEGEQLRVQGDTNLPRNWKSFLRVNSNKTSLSHYLAGELSKARVPEGKLLITTVGEQIIVNDNGSQAMDDTSGIEPCNHEEADTRLLLHCKHAYRNGKRRMVVATDTDVVVLAIAVLSVLPGCFLWVQFGHGRHMRFIAVHDIAANLGAPRSAALPSFYSFTGCDTCSSFKGIGKKTAWETWGVFPEVTRVFQSLSQCPEELTEEQLGVVQRFTILMYKRTSNLVKVNEARLQLFTQGQRQIDNIPPTKAALAEHTRRAAYQGGHTMCGVKP